MEKGSSSSSSNERKLTYAEIEKLTTKTIDIRRLHHLEAKHRGRQLAGGTVITYRDMTKEGYEWLLPGWVAEERKVRSGRLYRFYYDPEGKYYKTKSKVIEAMEKMGKAVPDKKN